MALAVIATAMGKTDSLPPTPIRGLFILAGVAFICPTEITPYIIAVRHISHTDNRLR
jgi:phage shock protein PspC (stress-responsive transcriptional regulator)